MARTSPLPPSLDRAAAAAALARGERIAISGLYGSARSLALAALAARGPVAAFVPDVVEAESLEEDLRALAPALRVLVVRPAEPGAAELAPEERADLSERLGQLRELAEFARGALALVPAAVLLDELPSRSDVRERAFTVEVGSRLDPAELKRRAADAGFAVVPMVAGPAEISLRGDIVDLFPLGENAPVRIEFFDDQVESIRTFDPETQRSTAARGSIAVPLVRPEELVRAARGGTFLPEHLAPGVTVARSETERLIERLEEHAAAFDLPRAAVKRARDWLATAPGVDLFGTRIEDQRAIELAVLSVQGFGGGIEELGSSLQKLRQRCPRAVVFCESDGDLKKLGQVLRDQGLLGEGLELRKGHVRTGFQLEQDGIAYLNHLELLGKPRLFRPKPRKPAVAARTIQNALELGVGDHVVHLTHGVARFNGMMRMKRDLGEEDYLVLEFDEGTIFYLAASKIDLVQRYVGTGAEPPKLDRIGGKSWAKKKAKVEQALADIADELLAVQAAREVRPGAAHAHDDALQREFERSFPYTDTVDQVRAMDEIHGDLDGKKPMDRLLCGDVGFGKTELAVRSAFRAVCSGKQVAVLVPTTLLAEQHYATFARRLANYPVNLAVLSRFRARKEIAATTAGLESGKVDIVVGTHRMLSADVRFKDLGLVVVDEEQRFGVKAKEALKQLRPTVDVLSLSATPIPRTLHMALVGIRDISSLNTPPAGRKPVKTEIRRYDKEFVRRAILFELTRGGQVFFVHNRVASIERIALDVAALTPLAKVAVAHGQMHESELDEVTRRFADGEVDVLVSTSIVESGLDLPRANTILIDRPDMFGLADLHQLRGRVGRSERQAHCYLLLRDRPLPEVAEKRLKAVEELSHLGAGYDLAIKDLEIRGAGNLLGASQHGHIAAVGYDLYVQLLRRAVARAKGQRPPQEPIETDVDLGVEAFLPVEYVPDPGQRMELLRRLGSPDGPPVADLEAEIRDRFGRPPEAAQNLFAVFALKRRCRELGVRRLIYPGDDHVLLEIADPRRFQRGDPFPREEAFRLTESVLHVRVPKERRAPAQVLALLSNRLLAPAPRGAPSR